MLRAAAIVLCSAGAAVAEPELFAITWLGDLYRVNGDTGATSFVGHTQFDRINSAAAGDDGMIYVNRGKHPLIATDENMLLRVDPDTAATTVVTSWGASNDLRGLAFWDGSLYAIRDGGTAPSDDLLRIDPASGIATFIGSTGRADLQGLTVDASGQFYALGVQGAGGTLVSISRATGAATVINPALNALGSIQTIEWAQENTAWIAHNNLRRINLLTGDTQIVGPLGASDVRGLALIGAAPGCYANCDGSTVQPVLNVDDFTCFINGYAAAQNLPHPQQVVHYANCDGSTIAPALNVDDFTCFINAYAQGCP